MSEHDKQIPIWYFIGILLGIYGLLILGTGIYGWFNPPAVKVALWNLHADVWWGALLTIIGAFYFTRFRPGNAAGR
jgi:integral membrane sensor domain MASE1